MNYFAALAFLIALGLDAYFVHSYDEYKYEAKYSSWQADEKTKLLAAATHATAIQAQLDAGHEKTVTVTNTVTKVVKQYVDRYVPAPGASTQTRPAYMLTRLDVSLWNSALEGSLSASAARAAETSPGPGDLELSGISFGDAFQNQIINAGQYSDCRAIVAGWQSWYEGVPHGN